jgi:hypothetical protein
MEKRGNAGDCGDVAIVVGVQTPVIERAVDVHPFLSNFYYVLLA